MIDEQVYNRPELLHFFSAGNSSNSGCSPMYGAFNYGNITGGRKAAKNVFAIANLLYDDNRVASSSRGPAEDGRTKPDLSGFGQGSLTTGPNNSLMTGSGTSAAAPSVAGVAALLVEAFRDLNNQQDPTADIIKALMLNTAEDLGRVGPDFDFGWGRVHAVRALECLQQNQYVRNTIYQGGTKDITINVPANTEQADIMLYWTDAKGSPVAAKALVNDLELEVLGPNGQTHLPWKLSTVAHPDSLTKPAYKGRDHINNMEQVTIHTPTAGTYTIRVSSYVLPSLAQDYVVTYSFTKDEIEVTFPHDEAALVPGENAVIRWDAVGNSGNFIIEYAVGNGSWNTVSSAVPGNRRHLDWIVPDIASANVRVRVRRGNHSDTSDGTFTVVGVPQVSAQTVVANSVKLSWPAVPGATEYEVFKLGDQYMEPVQTTTAADITLSAQPGQKHWYAVRAGITGQGYGKRSLAVPHTSYDCDENVQLVLNFDLFPAETSWSIKDQNGDELVSGGPYHNEPPQSTKQIDICLPYGCFDFTIFDTHNDGICCDDGNGSYQIVAADGDILVSGGIFAAQETKPFCIDNSGPPPLTISVTDQQNVSCHGLADGSVTVSAFGGNGNYSYLWSDGNVSPSRSNLPAGNYTVTVSDGTQQTVLSVAIIQPAPLTINLISTPPDCIGNSNGSIYAVVSEGSESQYTYAWSNGSNGSSISGLSAGTYAVTVTNSNGCTATQSTLLSSPSPIIADISSTPASCSTAEDGSISLENISGGTGNYSIVWSNGATTPTVTGLSPGNYGVTITDSNSCQASATVSISQPEPLAVEVTANAPMGDTLGNASTNTYGGTPPYNYNWSNGATGNTVGALEPGSYSLTVTDANNCTTSSSFTIEDPAIEVCESRGSSTQYEWIDSIAIGNFSHQSGNNGGSADFREDSTLWVHLEPGIPYDLTLVAGFNSSSFNEHWRIWIDFNQDGIFDDSNEEVLAPASSGQPVQGSISLPDTLADGAYAMRISMRYGSPPQACQSFPYGEVEDYLVIVEQVPEYCPSYALSSSSEWIASASFNGQAFDSGNDAGYGDYTDSLLTFAAGSTVQFELSPGFSLNTAPENWQIFIDFDGDGSFSVADERVYVRNDHPYAFSGSFVIPADVTTGNRRMRIVMSFDEEAPPCGSYVWGETEDYTVQLLPATNDGMEERTATAVPHNNWETEFSPGLLRVYPNPLRDRVFADLLLPKDGMLHYQLYNSAGQLLLQRQLELAAGRQQLNIPMASLPSGTYILSIRTLTEHWKRKLIKR